MKLNDLSTATIQIGEELRLPTMHTVNDHHIDNQIAGVDRMNECRETMCHLLPGEHGERIPRKCP